MLIFIARPARPEAAYWPARRALAAVDAVAWPLGVVYLLLMAGESTRLFGAVGAGVLALIALSRLRTAIWLNGHYRFTSWLVMKVFGTLIVVGLVLKLVAH